MSKMSSILKLIFLVIVFASCKKNESKQSEFFMNANINGTQTSFNSTFIDTMSSIGYRSMIISGIVNTNTTLSLQFTSDGAEFSFGSYPTSNNMFDLIAIFHNSSNNSYYNLQLSDFTVNLETVNSAYIAGNFAGVLKNLIYPGDSIVITNASFKSPIK